MKGQCREDPKGLIHEAFRIEGISSEECRSIFLDWALSLPDEQETSRALQEVIRLYAMDAPEHPMSRVLRDGLTSIATPRRRGGWRSRSRN